MKSKINAACIASILFAFGFPGVSAAQNGVRSLPVTDSETDEHAENSALLAMDKLIQENRRLKAELGDVRKSAAVGHSETEELRRIIKELNLRMEALGTSTTNPSALQQRLLQAINAMRNSENSKQELTKALARLAQVSSEFAKRPDAEAKIVLEAELKRVDQALTTAVAGPLIAQEKDVAAGNDLLNGKVSAFDTTSGCVVINLGAKQGVKVGMPFQVRRGAKIIGYVRVVDVRQTFAGSVIQNLVSEKDPVQLGDTVKVDAQLN